jgi:hypothetical protein
MESIHINLCHSKFTTVLLYNKLAMETVDMVLIQESWIYKESKGGLNSTGGTLIFHPMVHGVAVKFPEWC